MSYWNNLEQQLKILTRQVPNQLCPTNQMTFKEFYKDRLVKRYERQVKSQTYENEQFIFVSEILQVAILRISYWN